MSGMLRARLLSMAAIAAITASTSIETSDELKRDLERRQRREDFMLAVGKPKKPKKPSVRAKKRKARRP